MNSARWPCLFSKIKYENDYRRDVFFGASVSQPLSEQNAPLITLSSDLITEFIAKLFSSVGGGLDGFDDC